MEYKYLYIDDTKDGLEQGMINALSDGMEIEVKFKQPTDWENLIDCLKNELPEYDGIILDLRLNDMPYDDNKYAKYKGSTVAQELRSLTKEGALKKDFPIILFSGTDKIENYLDPTSRDLFDSIVDKTKIEQPGYFTYSDFRTKLKWLADGYRKLNSLEKKAELILKLSDLSILDSRFLDVLNNLIEKPIHVLAHFLVKEVIHKPCFLIDDNYLSARLGIDIKSPDWENLLNKLTACKYEGVFSNYHRRWWMHLILNFWETEISKEENLRTTKAEKRVQLIRDKTGLIGLNPIVKGSKSKSESFWMSCKATGAAIDTVDGFTIAGQDNKFPWQEPEYISIEEALRPSKNYTISITERPRLQKLKEILEANEQRSRK